MNVCPFDKFNNPDGATVCQGCGAEQTRRPVGIFKVIAFFMMLAVIPISFFGAYLGFMVTAQFIGLERENLLLLLVGGLVGMFAAGIGFVLIGGRLIPKETVWVRASVA